MKENNKLDKKDLEETEEERKKRIRDNRRLKKYQDFLDKHTIILN